MTSYFGPLEDVSFGIPGNNFDYDAFKLWIERQQLNFTKSISIGGDLVSANWNGARPPALTAADTAATTGFALDSSAGAAQFQQMFVGGSAGFMELLTDSAAGRIQWKHNDLTNKGYILAGATNIGGGDIGTLEIRAPYDGGGGVSLTLTGAAVADGGNVLTYGGERIRSTTAVIHLGAGSASAPVYSFDNDTNSGMLSIAADRIGWSVGGNTLLDLGTVAGTGLRSVAVRDVTTGSAASVFINATTGQMARSTSTLSDKSFVTEDVRNVLKYRLRPNRHFRKDDQRWRYGFIAEWIAAIDPALGEYDDFGNIVNYDTRGIQAVLAAKIERLEDFVRSLPSGLRAGWIE